MEGTAEDDTEVWSSLRRTTARSLAPPPDASASGEAGSPAPRRTTPIMDRSVRTTRTAPRLAAASGQESGEEHTDVEDVIADPRDRSARPKLLPPLDGGQGSSASVRGRGTAGDEAGQGSFSFPHLQAQTDADDLDAFATRERLRKGKAKVDATMATNIGPRRAPPTPPAADLPPPPPSGATASTYASPSSSSPLYPFLSSPTLSRPRSCAACNHQRRRCPDDCILKPYFPYSEPEKFRNVQELFGVKGMLDLLNAAGPALRDKCMRSIQLEADTRRQEPVHGCSAVIRELENQLRDSFIELAVVLRQRDLLLQQSAAPPAALNNLHPPANNPLGAASPMETATTSVDVFFHQQQPRRTETTELTATQTHPAVTATAQPEAASDSKSLEYFLWPHFFYRDSHQ